MSVASIANSAPVKPSPTFSGTIARSTSFEITSRVACIAFTRCDEHDVCGPVAQNDWKEKSSLGVIEAR